VILLREIQEQDLEALEKFSNVPGMYNLPADRELLREKILSSKASFADRVNPKSEAKFIFAAVDLSEGSGRLVGTSMIAAQHGSPESPHFYFEVGSERKFSETINTGFIHGTLKLKYDTDGPSEIGGLVIDPDYRRHEARIGRQISFVRFLFLGLHRTKFRKRVIAELLPPLNKRGQSPLWEAIGRRFTNMDYWEADQLCQKDKEFILSLFPAGTIYTSFLSAEARNSVGKVGKDTEPVVHMLKKIGFKFVNQVDPFDGGPHFWADVEELLPVRKLKHGVFAPSGSALEPEEGLLTRVHPSAGFRAVHAQGAWDGDRFSFGPDTSEEARNGAIRELGLSVGDAIAFMPYY